MTQTPQRTLRFAAACHAGRGERSLYAVIAIVMLAFSVSFFADSLLIGSIAGVLALNAAATAITAFCPSGWFLMGSLPDEPDEVLGFPVAHGVVALAADQHP